MKIQICKLLWPGPIPSSSTTSPLPYQFYSPHPGFPAVLTMAIAGRLQGLCTCCALYFESSPSMWLIPFLFLLKCHFVRKAFPGNPVLLYDKLSPISPLLCFPLDESLDTYNIILCLSFVMCNPWKPDFFCFCFVSLFPTAASLMVEQSD